MPSPATTAFPPPVLAGSVGVGIGVVGDQ
jgi:hypothetical protein